jgi:hypothetical protein
LESKENQEMMEFLVREAHLVLLVIPGKKALKDILVLK